MNIFGCDKVGFWQILERFQNSKDINQIRTACLYCLYVLGLVTHIYRRFEKSGCAKVAKNVGSYRLEEHNEEGSTRVTEPT